MYDLRNQPKGITNFNPQMDNSPQIVKIDKPHQPYGQHVDVITPLESGIPGVEKIRIGGTGQVITQEILIKHNY
jgi:hypothetical protein